MTMRLTCAAGFYGSGVKKIAVTQVVLCYLDFSCLCKSIQASMCRNCYTLFDALFSVYLVTFLPK